MMLRTIGLISALALGLLTVQLPAEAQQAGKVYRIGFLDYRLRSTTTDPRLMVTWFLTDFSYMRDITWDCGSNG